MIERLLLTPDELKSLPKGDFIVMKTGVHLMRVHIKMFFKWDIAFDEKHPYAVPDQGNREVKYADKKEIQDGILEKISAAVDGRTETANRYGRRSGAVGQPKA